MDGADIDRTLLPLVEKPVRYAGSLSRTAPPSPGTARVRGACVVPELLEDGISDTTLRAVLACANSKPGSWAEPVFAPGNDMARSLAAAGIPWFTAWSRHPLREADYILLCLRTPLMMTSALAVLDAAGVPLRSGDRRSGDPIVAALIGGAFAPGPLGRFVDVFLVGEATAPVAGWIELLLASGNPRAERDRVLLEASGRDGLRVPARSGSDGESTICRARLLDPAGATGGGGDALFSPSIAPASGEYFVRTSLGFPPGSRLHPWSARREWLHRPAAEILGEASRLLLLPGVRRIQFGAEEEDHHPKARPIAEEIVRRLLGQDVEVAFEASRSRAYSPPPLPALARMRQSAAFFPESGAERTRRVLGLRADDAELVDGATRAAYDGVQSLRVGFTLGHPGGEADEAGDLVSLVQRIQRANRNPKQRWRVSVEIAPFIPRPWTPFQWDGFIPPDEYRRRSRAAADGLGRLKIRPRVRKAEASLVEAALVRGDRSLGDLIETAYSLGARRDHEPEHFRFEPWDEAARRLGLDLAALAAATDPASEPAWRGIEFGASGAELRGERTRALAGEASVEVSVAPAAVALDDGDLEGSSMEDQGRSRFGRRPKPRGPHAGVYGEAARFRLRYRKAGAARFLSHLDLVHLFNAAFLRLGVPLALEKGRQKISYGPPLPVGMTGEDEYLDVELSRPARPDVFQALGRHLPRDVDVIEARVIRGDPASLDSAVTAAVYRVVIPVATLTGTEWEGRAAGLRQRLADTVADFLSRSEVPYRGPRGESEYNLRDEVFFIEALPDEALPGIRVGVWLRMGGRIRPEGLLARLLGDSPCDPRLFEVARERLIVRAGETERTPMEVLEASRSADGATASSAPPSEVPTNHVS
jgi:radical SAM-linked protein